MDQIVSCPACHQPIAPGNYFCANCGKQLRTPPPSKSFSALVFLFLKTVLLPPFGFIWGFRYLRQSDTASKIIGWITILVTLVETIWLVQITVDTVNQVNQQINNTINLYGL